MIKPVQSSEEFKQNKVWQPSSYEGMEIGIKNSKSGLRFPKHYMQDYTIVLNGKGEGKVNYGSQHYNFNNIDRLVFLQNPGNVFSGQFWGENGTSGACLVLSRSLFSRVQNMLDLKGNAFFSSMLLSEKTNTYIAKFVAESIRTFVTPTSRLERDSKLLSLIEAVLKYGSDISIAQNYVGKEHQAVSIVREILHAYPGENLSINNLSRITGLNPKYLINVFTKNVGLPPHRYLISLRIHQAKSRLAKGETIALVAQELGFYDQSHFSNTFKQYVRVSPGQFKQDSIERI